MKHKIFLGLFGVMLIAMLAVGCGSATPTATPVLSKPTTEPPTNVPTATIVRPTSAPTQPTLVPTIAVPTTVPTATTARPTNTPVPPTVVPNTAAPTSANYDGEWNGNTSSDGPFSLIVEKNQLTSFNINYGGPAGTCPSMSLSYGKSLDNAPIKGKDFSAQATFDDGDQVTLTGSFISTTELAGSFTIKGKGQFCGAFEVKGTFAAKPGAKASASSNPTPIAYNASKNLQSFFDAINAKNVDAALALVDDTFTYNFASTIGSGKVALKSYLQNQISRGIIYTLSNLDDQGDSVDFSLKIGNGAVKDGNMAAFDDNGKLDFMVIK